MTAETITRADLINKITQDNKLTRQQASDILKKTLEEIENQDTSKYDCSKSPKEFI